MQLGCNSAKKLTPNDLQNDLLTTDLPFQGIESR